MFFHWGRVYGEDEGKATAVVEGVFAAARKAEPQVFRTDSRLEPARQAKFEHVCAFLAGSLAKGVKPAQKRRILEEMVDRLEVGLREAGVGDMVVGKQVRAYAAAMNGRLARYGGLISAKKWPDFGRALAEHGVGAGVAEKVRIFVADGAGLR